MCTVTWNSSPDGFHVFCNRDEQRSRPKARPTTAHTSNAGNRFLAPIDPVGGGTWIAVNASGLLVTLLNFYQRENVASTTGPATSRGLLVTGLMDCNSPAEVRATLPDRVGHARAFHLLALQPNVSPRAWTWDGANLSEEPAPEQQLPWSSSSFRTDDVLAWRRDQYLALAHAPATVETAQAFHATRHPNDPAFGVCMDRDDACTQSFSHICIAPKKITYTYRDGFPDDADAPTTQEHLARDTTGDCK